ncbi:MAG: hypothetical protein J5I47_04560 [Vicingus serpentipes]|nr:hypothetical protein [Vicingus serpentipes]
MFFEIPSQAEDDVFILYFSKMRKMLFTLLIGASFFGCREMKVDDVKIEIKTYNEKDRGKFWNICLYGSDKSTTCKGYMILEVFDKKKKKKTFEIGLVHLKGLCNKKNIFNFATGRNTSKEDMEWYKNLNASDVEKIHITVFECSRDHQPIFEKNLVPTEMK